MTATVERLRTALRRAILVSVTFNAALAVWALLADEFGDTQGRVLATSFLVTGAMLGILVNGPALRARTAWPLPILAATAAAVGVAFLIGAVWSNADNVVVMKSGVSGLVVGAAATLVCAVQLVPRRAALRLPQTIAAVVLATLAASLLWSIWAEPDSEVWLRMVGIQSVVVAALVIGIPVWSRLAPAARPSSGPDLTHCPHCGADLSQPPASADVVEAYQGKP